MKANSFIRLKPFKKPKVAFSKAIKGKAIATIRRRCPISGIWKKLLAIKDEAKKRIIPVIPPVTKEEITPLVNSKLLLFLCSATYLVKPDPIPNPEIIIPME